MIIKLKIETDDDNTYPTEYLKIEISDSLVYFNITDQDREVAISKKEFEQFLKLF